MAASRHITLTRNRWIWSRRFRTSHNLGSQSRGCSHEARLLEADVQAVERAETAAKGHKQHPGKLVLRKVTPTQRLQAAVSLLLDRFPVPDLERKSEQLNKSLRARHPPTSDAELQRLARQLEKAAKEKDGRNPEELEFEESQKYERKIRKEVLSTLKKKVYHWQPLRFDESSSVVYVAARMAQNYSILTQCLSEICRRDPEFVPRSMYNFGSGTGSAIWAAHGLWRERLFEYYCVDPSPAMHAIARLLLQDVDDQKAMHIREVYFRQFAPSPLQNNFDLVVCSHTLMEMASKEERLAAVLDLWRMTNHYLVLVDVGTGAGFKVINEARSFILQLEDPELEGHVFSPCPHDQVCPKLAQRSSPCFFQISYSPLQILNVKETKRTDTYSYVVLKKGRRPEGEGWPRVVQEVLVRKKHTHCHLCCPSGHLMHAVLTAKKHGRDAYRFARYSRWGDLLPVVLPGTSSQPQVDADSVPEDPQGLGTEDLQTSGAPESLQSVAPSAAAQRAQEGDPAVPAGSSFDYPPERK